MNGYTKMYGTKSSSWSTCFGISFLFSLPLFQSNICWHLSTTKGLFLVCGGNFPIWSYKDHASKIFHSAVYFHPSGNFLINVFGIPEKYFCEEHITVWEEFKFWSVFSRIYTEYCKSAYLFFMLENADQIKLRIWPPGSSSDDNIILPVRSLMGSEMTKSRLLHKKCPYLDFFCSVFSWIWTEYGNLQSRVKLEKTLMSLTHFFLLFSFDPSGNISMSKVFWWFRGEL